MKLLGLLILFAASQGSLAQDTGFGGPSDPNYRFQPPQPPPLDTNSDFEDFDEDMVEMDEEGFEPPLPPSPPSGLPSNMGRPPMPPSNSSNDYPPPSFTGGDRATRSNPGKLRFQIVDGEFFEPGKKRGRGEKLRSSGSSN